jgi:hypothetical protein
MLDPDPDVMNADPQPWSKSLLLHLFSAADAATGGRSTMAAHHTRGERRHVQVRRQQRDAIREAGQESGGGEGAAQQASHPFRKGFSTILYLITYYSTYNNTGTVTIS